MVIFIHSSEIATDYKSLSEWHKRPAAFERLLPPWENIEMLSASNGIYDGAQVKIKVKQGPIAIQWWLEHFACMEIQHEGFSQFGDRQLVGPFSEWQHLHQFKKISDSSSQLLEEIEFKAPFSYLSALFIHPFILNKLKKLFNYRHELTKNDILLDNKYRGKKRMKILISGASGLVGSALLPLLKTQGHEVHTLVRRQLNATNEIYWNFESGEIETSKLDGFDAVIHLAGENIAEKRWNDKQKQKIKETRVAGTKFLSDTMAKLQNPPKIFITASAIGFYANRGDEVLTEQSHPGDDFLAHTCVEWEQASQAAKHKGIRVVHARFGVILSPKGGALAKILTPFSMGVGGILGDGKQYMSWISIEDVIGALYHALMNDSILGPLNVVAPKAVTNKEFTEVLARVLSRPALFPAPGFALRLLLGEMADALLLSSTRVEPKKLLETAYDFRYPELESALRFLLAK